MAWIELHQTVWTHRKTVALAEALDLDDTYAAAHVARLWSWALDNAIIDHDAKRGLLTGMSARVIATGAGWKGDAPAFVAALRGCGYIDDHDGQLVLHDWWDYAGKYLDKREKNAARMRAVRAHDTAQAPTTESATHVQCTLDARAGATVPNLTVPGTPTNHDSVDNRGTTAPARDVPAREAPAHVTREEPAAPASPPRYSAPFEAFWRPYPRPDGRAWDKPAAYKAYRRLRPDGEMADAIIAGVAAWALGRDWQRGFIKSPANFLAGRLWETPPEPWSGSDPARASPVANGHGPPDKLNDVIIAGIKASGARHDDRDVRHEHGDPLHDLAPPGADQGHGGAHLRHLPARAG